MDYARLLQAAGVIRARQADRPPVAAEIARKLDAAWAANDLAAAEQHLAELPHTYRVRAQGRHRSARLHLARGRNQEAIEEWRHALLDSTASARLLEEIRAELAEIGIDAVTLATEESAAASLSRDFARDTRLAYLSGDLSRACEGFQRELEMDPHSGRAAANLARVRELTGDTVGRDLDRAAALAREEDFLQAAQVLDGLIAAGNLPQENFAEYLHVLRRAGEDTRACSAASAGADAGVLTVGACLEWAASLLDQSRIPEGLEVLGRWQNHADDGYRLQVAQHTSCAAIHPSVSAEREARERLVTSIAAIGDIEVPEDATARRNLADAILPSFYLSYLGACDRTERTLVGKALRRAMRAAYPDIEPEMSLASRHAGSRIRVGYATSHASFHSVVKQCAGWLQHHDRSAFEVHLFPLASERDWMTDFLAQQCETMHHGTVDLTEACRQIVGADLDILVYLDLGMERLSYQAAALRLAPIQCTTWGHPVTSGLATIDFFLSSDLMEPEDGDEHYSERLIRLPGIGVCVPRARPTGHGANKSQFGMPEDAVVFLCLQSLFKYRPGDDDIYPAIAGAVSNACFVFIEGQFPAWTRTLQHRFHTAFAAAGLSADRHIHFLPRLGYESYLELNSVGDVFLDSIGWSGCNTTIEAVACGVPVITLPGSLMRSRHSYAILKQGGLEFGIANSKIEYIQKAIQLGTDPGLRARHRAATNAAHERIFDDARSVNALEDFYRNVAQSKATSAQLAFTPCTDSGKSSNDTSIRPEPA